VKGTSKWVKGFGCWADEAGWVAGPTRLLGPQRAFGMAGPVEVQSLGKRFWIKSFILNLNLNKSQIQTTHNKIQINQKSPTHIFYRSLNICFYKWVNLVENSEEG
jgi:hypothetical protein